MMNNSQSPYDIPTDILHCIFEQIRLNSPQDLLNVALVSRTFADLTRSYIFYLTVLNTARPSCEERLKRIEEDPVIRYRMREVHVINSVYDAGVDDAIERAVISRLVNMEMLKKSKLNLKHFVWTTDINFDPSTEAMIISAFPACRLSIYLGLYQGKPLPYSEHLVSISARTLLRTDPLLHFQSVLSKCPKLKNLDIHGYQRLGCRVHEGPDPYLPAWTSIFLDNDACSNLEELRLSHFSRSADIDLLSRMVLRKLDSLVLEHFFDEDFLEGLASLNGSSTPSLRRFVFHTEFYDANPTYMMKAALSLGRVIQSLSTIGLVEVELQGVSNNKVFKAIADFQGSTLRRLKLHNPEDSHKGKRDTLSVFSFIYLGEKCVYLEELYVDVDELLAGSQLSLKTINECFKSSSKLFPRLCSMHISSTLGIPTCVPPSANAVTAAEKLGEEITIRSSSLRNLHLEMGEQNRERHPTWWNIPSWFRFEMQFRYKYTVTKAWDGTISTTCSDLSSRMRVLDFKNNQTWDAHAEDDEDMGIGWIGQPKMSLRDNISRKFSIVMKRLRT